MELDSHEATIQVMIAEMAAKGTPSDATDADIVAASIASPSLFDRIYDQHHDAVFRYAASRAGAQAAEDIVGEVFATAFATRARFDRTRGCTALPWLLGIATRLISRRNDLERRWFRNLAAAPEARLVEDFEIDDVQRRADAAQKKIQLTAAVLSLSCRLRDPLLLHVLAGLTYEETANALGLPVGTVRSRISRARIRLASTLDQERSP